MAQTLTLTAGPAIVAIGEEETTGARHSGFHDDLLVRVFPKAFREWHARWV
jgi:hypothetical protein